MDRQAQENVVAVVHRRFSVFEAVVHTNRPCDFVRAHLDAEFESASSFVIRSRRGFVRHLRPSVTGRIEETAAGCDVEFRIAFPPAWWALAAALFIVISIDALGSSAAERPLLLSCLAILLFVAVVPLR